MYTYIVFILSRFLAIKAYVKLRRCDKECRQILLHNKKFPYNEIAITIACKMQII